MIVGIFGGQLNQREELAKAIASEAKRTVIISFDEVIKDVYTLLTGESDFSDKAMDEKVAVADITGKDMLYRLSRAISSVDEMLYLAATCIKHSKAMNAKDKIVVITTVQSKKEMQWLSNSSGFLIRLANNDLERRLLAGTDRLICMTDNIQEYGKKLAGYLIAAKNLDASPAEVKDAILKVIKTEQHGK